MSPSMIHAKIFLLYLRENEIALWESLIICFYDNTQTLNKKILKHLN